MIYEEKVAKAAQLIADVLKVAKNPCVMCSFGKDSIAVLHMVKKQRDLKVVFHREPFQHHKYEYANRVMLEWDLAMVDYPPLGTTVQDGDEFEIVNQYQAGNRHVYLPTGIRPPVPGHKLVCGLDDIYNKPTGTFNYPFDMAFHGHKSVDVDPILGAVPLRSDVAMNLGAISAAFPLRHFTNDDVWRYIEENGIPIHHERYEKVDSQWRERADKTLNPDYMNACTACMSAKNGPSVFCPKLNCEVSTVAHQLRPTVKPDLKYHG